MFITVVMIFVHGNMSDCAVVDPTEAFHPVESFLNLLDDDDVDVQHLRADFQNVRQHLRDAQQHWNEEQQRFQISDSGGWRLLGRRLLHP